MAGWGVLVVLGLVVVCATGLPDPAESEAREAMKPSPLLPPDEDCDSPQIGESETLQTTKKTVDMNSKDSRAGAMKQQPEATKVVPLDDFEAAEDDKAAFQGPENSHPSELLKPMDLDSESKISNLPEPLPDLPKRTKCSRSKNVHDVPDTLAELDDEDCGSPEPVIKCETPGNSTLCDPAIILKPPVAPVAERMPPIPKIVPPKVPVVQHTNISVEFVDFGYTNQVFAHTSLTVARIIEEAGDKFAIAADTAQLIRNAGADVDASTLVADLVDQKELIVYLKCAHERFHGDLINSIPSCEDLKFQQLIAKVEIPAYRAVYPIRVKSNQAVGDVIRNSPVLLPYIARITYNGENVTMDTPLSSIDFHNNSVFVVYPHEPCESHSPSPSLTATARPSPSATPTMSPYPTPQRGRPVLIDHGVRAPAFVPGSRPMMTRDATIILEVEGRRIPVLISPVARGSDLLEAAALVTKQKFTSAVFLDRKIGSDSSLNVFGFVDGDVVRVEPGI